MTGCLLASSSAVKLRPAMSRIPTVSQVHDKAAVGGWIKPARASRMARANSL
jgi:hypothetical protein